MDGMVASHVAVMETIGRLGLALVLGMLIGLERQWHLKLAGLSTNTLVALGSCGFVVFASMVSTGDPMRIAAQVVSGIVFLGAGVILREGISVAHIVTTVGEELATARTQPCDTARVAEDQSVAIRSSKRSFPLFIAKISHAASRSSSCIARILMLVKESVGVHQDDSPARTLRFRSFGVK
jgi:hypothetical protein